MTRATARIIEGDSNIAARAEEGAMTQAEKTQAVARAAADAAGGEALQVEAEVVPVSGAAAENASPKQAAVNAVLKDITRQLSKLKDAVSVDKGPPGISEKQIQEVERLVECGKENNLCMQYQLAVHLFEGRILVRNVVDALILLTDAENRKADFKCDQDYIKSKKLWLKIMLQKKRLERLLATGCRAGSEVSDGYYLGDWHERNGNDEAALDCFMRAATLAETVIKTKIETGIVKKGINVPAIPGGDKSKFAPVLYLVGVEKALVGRGHEATAAQKQWLSAFTEQVNKYLIRALFRRKHEENLKEFDILIQSRVLTKYAECLLKGKGVEQGPSDAFYYLLLAACSLDPRAQYKLGELYREGKWIHRNDQLAAFWFRRCGDESFFADEFLDTIRLFYKVGGGKAGWSVYALTKARALLFVGRYHFGVRSYVKALSVLKTAMYHSKLVHKTHQTDLVICRSEINYLKSKSHAALALASTSVNDLQNHKKAAVEHLQLAVLNYNLELMEDAHPEALVDFGGCFADGRDDELYTKAVCFASLQGCERGEEEVDSKWYSKALTRIQAQKTSKVGVARRASSVDDGEKIAAEYDEKINKIRAAVAEYLPGLKGLDARAQSLLSQASSKVAAQPVVARAQPAVPATAVGVWPAVQPQPVWLPASQQGQPPVGVRAQLAGRPRLVTVAQPASATREAYMARLSANGGMPLQSQAPVVVGQGSALFTAPPGVRYYSPNQSSRSAGLASSHLQNGQSAPTWSASPSQSR